VSRVPPSVRWKGQHSAKATVWVPTEDGTATSHSVAIETLLPKQSAELVIQLLVRGSSFSSEDLAKIGDLAEELSKWHT
jgi:hypothetical protein